MGMSDKFSWEISIREPTLQWLVPILNEWAKMNARYSEAMEDQETPVSDCLYWHNERTTLSTLGSAVWCKGGLAVQEYPAAKGLRDEDGAMVVFDGRIDMYLSLGEDETVIEAKQRVLFPQMNNQGYSTAPIALRMDAARADVLASLHEEDTCGYGVALVILTPVHSLAFEQGNVNADQVAVIKQHVLEDYDFGVWLEKTAGEDLVSVSEYEWIYNRVALVGMRVPR